MLEQEERCNVTYYDIRGCYIIAVDTLLIVTNKIGNRRAKRLVNHDFARFDASVPPFEHLESSVPRSPPTVLVSVRD